MIMKEKINNLIPHAISAITFSGIADNECKVQKEFKGYIASIGASIIQAGLLPTLAFYQKTTGKNADSWRVLDAVMRLINANQNNMTLIHYVIECCNPPNNNNSRCTYKDLDKEKLSLIEEDIMDAIIALKLALRTFKIENDE